MLILLPFAWLPDPAVPAVLIGLACGVLGYSWHHEKWRLLALLSWPAFLAYTLAQWSPIFLAVAVAPLLYPLLVAKPNIALPVVVLRFTWRRAFAAAALGGLSLLVYPGWIPAFLATTGTYTGFVPVLAVPVLLVVIAAVLWRRWRDESAWWFVLTCVSLIRGWYDLLLVVMAIETRRLMLVYVSLSWVFGMIHGLLWQTAWLAFVPHLVIGVWLVCTPPPATPTPAVSATPPPKGTTTH
jgi:hypothetical protein